jgi:Type II secretion system (T2SS), protein G
LKAAHPDRVDEKGQVVDTWGNPYLYQSDGNTYTLISFGRDGKRGGDGMDQDIEARVVRSSEEDFFEFPDVGVPTLRQFVFECETGGVRLASALAGIFAFIACIVAWKPDRRRLLLRAAGLILALAACFVTGFFMCALHVPNHH